MISLDELRTRRRHRDARVGRLGPVLKALHDTADLMDAHDRRQARYDWLNGNRPTPSSMDAAFIVTHLSDVACLGLTDISQWHAMWHERRRRGYATARAWLDDCHRVQDEVRAILAPNGFGHDVPHYTATQIRELADRLAA